MIFQVRRAAHGDVLACGALYERVARETFTWFAAEDISAADLIEDFAVEEFHVAASEDGIIGLAGFYRPDSFLHSLYVAAPARGIGVGSALLAAVNATADGPLSLKVQKRNAAAQAFYRRKGFVFAGEGDLTAPGGGWWLMRQA